MRRGDAAEPLTPFDEVLGLGFRVQRGADRARRRLEVHTATCGVQHSRFCRAQTHTRACRIALAELGQDAQPLLVPSWCACTVAQDGYHGSDMFTLVHVQLAGQGGGQEINFRPGANVARCCTSEGVGTVCK